MADLSAYDVIADELSGALLEHSVRGCYCEVPGDDWTIAGLIRRAEAHEAEAHRPVVDGYLIGPDGLLVGRGLTVGGDEGPALGDPLGDRQAGHPDDPAEALL
jgi:hypothetical protein